MKLSRRHFIAFWIGFVLTLGLGVQAHATSYYVSNSGCSDGNTGTDQSTPWCSFNNINGMTFQPGDVINLASGSTWNQELDLSGNGNSRNWITVTSYGSGARPIINRNDASGSTVGVVLTNPNYWSINNLMVENAGIGIEVYFTAIGNQGLSFSNIYMAGIQGVDSDPGGTVGPIGTRFNTGYGGGISFSDNGQLPTITGSQYVLSGLTMNAIEGTNNVVSLFIIDQDGCFTGPNGPYAIQNVLLQNLYVHNDTGGTLGGLMIQCTNNAIVEDSVFNADASAYESPGTVDASWYGSQNISFINDVFTNVQSTGSPDGSGVDQDEDNNNISYNGNYFAGNAGAGIELLEIKGSYNSNSTISNNLFVNNGGGSANGAAGAVATAGCDYLPTGTASNNLYYEPSYGFDVVFNGSSSGCFADFTFSNNLAADSASDTWNSVNGFSGTQGQNQWSYLDTAGAMTFVSWENLYFSSWVSGCGGQIFGSMMVPDSCNGDTTSRVWQAPKAGNISIRGWAAKHVSGGSGVQLSIVQNSTVIWSSSLAGTDTTGFSTNADLTVAQGDSIQFEINNNNSGNNTDDAITWAPSIVYTSSSGGSLAPGNYRLVNVGNPNVSLQWTGDNYPGYTTVNYVAATPNGWNDQVWTAQGGPNGSFVFVNAANPGYQLQATGDTYKNSTNVFYVVASPTSWGVGPYQQWQLQPAGNGNYYIINVGQSGSALQATGDQYMSVPGAFNVVVSPLSLQLAAQQWTFVAQ